MPDKNEQESESSPPFDSMQFVVEPRKGFELYLGTHGHVVIMQQSMDGDSTVILHHEEASKLLNFLPAIIKASAQTLAAVELQNT